MAIMKIEYHSEALDMSRQVTVLYPDRNRVENPDDNDIPVLYLCTVWEEIRIPG